MKGIKKESVFSFMAASAVGVTSSLATAYFVDSKWSKEIERFKSKISFEREAAIHSFESSSELFLLASTIYQNAAHFHGAKLLPDSLSKAAKVQIDNFMKSDARYPKVTYQEVFEMHNEFQIKLMASKHFLPNELFEKLAAFSSKGSHLLFENEKSYSKMKEYKEWGESLDEAIQTFRKSYSLETLEASVLMLQKEKGGDDNL